MLDIIQKFKFFTTEECQQIKEYAYKKEKELVDEGHADWSYHEYGSITSNNYFRYNFFRDHPLYKERLIKFLSHPNVKHQLKWPIKVQSWVNIYRKGQGVTWHNHIGDMRSSCSANIFIDGPTEPGTTYLIVDGQDLKEVDKENRKGYIQLSPCFIYHKVKLVESERVSVGITLHSYDFDNKNTKNTTNIISLRK